MRFEWDPDKARINLRKHGVAFEDAFHIFEDPYALLEQDRIDAAGELRWHAMGTANGMTVLLVVHTLRDDKGVEVIRIISARRATRNERIRYEEARR